MVAPFYGYARQDRKAEGREPITAKLIANMFKAAGAKRLVSVDLHSGQIQGFFDGPVDHLTAMPVLVDWMATTSASDLVVVSPDAGRVKVAERYANQLHADLAIVHKRRVKGVKNAVEAKDVVGEVDGRTCVLIDDMIDTGGTIVAAAEQLAERGATAVYAAATHGVFCGPGHRPLKNSVIEKVVITNTLPLPAREADRQDRGAVGRPASSPTPSTPSSRTPRSPRSSTARTSTDRSDPVRPRDGGYPRFGGQNGQRGATGLFDGRAGSVPRRPCASLRRRVFAFEELLSWLRSR